MKIIGIILVVAVIALLAVFCGGLVGLFKVGEVDGITNHDYVGEYDENNE